MPPDLMVVFLTLLFLLGRSGVPPSTLSQDWLLVFGGNITRFFLTTTNTDVVKYVHVLVGTFVIVTLVVTL